MKNSQPTIQGDFKGNSKTEFLKSKPFGLLTLLCILGAIFAFLLTGPDKTLAVESKKKLEVPVTQRSEALKIPLYSVPKADVAQSRPMRSATTRKKKSQQQNQKTSGLAGPQVIQRPREVILPPGVKAMAILESGASDGTVKAVLPKPVSVAGEERIEGGSVLVGEAQSGNNRLQIRFTNLVFPNGEFLRIRAKALDAEDQMQGLKGSNVSNYASKLAALTGLKFIAGLSDGLKEREALGEQVVDKTSTKNALLNGAREASLEHSTEMLRDLKSEKPQYEVPRGTPIVVIFEDVSPSQ